VSKPKIVIALAVICMFLTIMVLGALGGYLSVNSALQDKKGAYDSLQSQYSDYQSSHSHANDAYNALQSSSSSSQSGLDSYKSTHSFTNDEYFSANSQLADAKSQVTSLQSDKTDLNAIISLQDSTVWMNNQVVQQQAGTYIPYSYTANYPGYVKVQVQSTTNSQYVEVIWSANGVNYDNKIVVGASGTAVFPVLPSSLQIRIGNGNIISPGASATTSITYYY
jgi:hypothetical protein